LKGKKQWFAAENKKHEQAWLQTPKKPPTKKEKLFEKEQENLVENTIDKQLFLWYLEQCLVQPLPQCKACASNALLGAKCWAQLFFCF
jgi:hypothetical protein